MYVGRVRGPDISLSSPRMDSQRRPMGDFISAWDQQPERDHRSAIRPFHSRTRRTASHSRDPGAREDLSPPAPAPN
jgi:hypothetical protein